MIKLHVLFLVSAILLLALVAADPRKLVGKLSKAYKPQGESDDMEPEMANEQPDMMTNTGDDDATLMDSMMEQSPPMEQSYARDHRYNPLFGHYYVKLMPYGVGLLPYGGVMAAEHPMMMAEANNEMRDEMERNPHPNIIA